MPEDILGSKASDLDAATLTHYGVQFILGLPPAALSTSGWVTASEALAMGLTILVRLGVEDSTLLETCRLMLATLRAPDAAPPTASAEGWDDA